MTDQATSFRSAFRHSVSATSSAPVVELTGVTIRYQSADGHPLDIVTDYGLRLDRGEMHCLAGRSGSGKTSILRVAAGLARPTTGDVLWNGDSIAKLGALGSSLCGVTSSATSTRPAR